MNVQSFGLEELGVAKQIKMNETQSPSSTSVYR
jgi:hypothetical protein